MCKANEEPSQTGTMHCMVNKEPSWTDYALPSLHLCSSLIINCDVYMRPE